MIFTKFMGGFLFFGATCLVSLVGTEYAFRMISAKDTVVNFAGLGLLGLVVLTIVGSVFVGKKLFGGEKV